MTWPLGSRSPDVLKRDKILVNKNLVDLGQDVQPFCDFSEHGVDSIQVIQVLPGCDEKLRNKLFWLHIWWVHLLFFLYSCPKKRRIWQVSKNSLLIHLRAVLVISVVHHGNRPLLPVLDAWCFLRVKEARLVSVQFAADPEHRQVFRARRPIPKQLKPFYWLTRRQILLHGHFQKDLQSARWSPSEKNTPTYSTVYQQIWM